MGAERVWRAVRINGILKNLQGSDCANELKGESEEYFLVFLDFFFSIIGKDKIYKHTLFERRSCNSCANELSSESENRFFILLFLLFMLSEIF